VEIFPISVKESPRQPVPVRTRTNFVLDDAPRRVYWEITRACDLACSHCRASAVACRNERELSTAEACGVLDDLATFKTPAPHVILTGGDPLKRPDFFEILEHAVNAGLPCLVAPSATPLLTKDVIKALAASRIAAMSLSIDGSNPGRHDGLRGVPGTFDRTLTAARAIIEAGISLQINTLVTSETRHDLPAIYELVKQIGADRWSLFFLITTGRGRTLGQITPEASEELMHWTLDRAGESRTIVTTTEAPHYRRVALSRQKSGLDHVSKTGAARGFGIRDGNGVMFLSHTGEVQPSGFLPLTAGQIRDTPPLQIYRESALFQGLRRPDEFEGRCGRCEFRHVCGGSRARAYAATGNPLGADPLCPYDPGPQDFAKAGQ
jgi:radical SAM protein